MADYEEELSPKHGENVQASSLQEQCSVEEQDYTVKFEASESNSTATINDSKSRQDEEQESANGAVELNRGGEYSTKTIQFEAKNDTAKQMQHQRHLIDVDDETVLTLAARFNVNPMHLLSSMQQKKEEFYRTTETRCFVDSFLKKNIIVDLPVSTTARYLVCPKSVEGWLAWLTTTKEAFKAGNMDFYLADADNQTYSSLNLQRENYLESLNMVAIQSLGESERKLIQADLKFARDRMHHFFSGWWRCEFCNASCFQSLAEMTEHEETCSQADAQEFQNRRLKGKPDIGFANASPCGDKEALEKMEDTARAFLEAAVDEDLTWRTFLPAEVEEGEFTLFHVFQTVFPSCAHPIHGLKIEQFNALAKELFPVRENVFPGIKKIFLGASLRDVKADGEGSKFWRTFVQCLGVNEKRVEEIQDIILQYKEAWESRLDELLQKLPAHLDFLSLNNSRKLAKADQCNTQPNKSLDEIFAVKETVVESELSAAASTSNDPSQTQAEADDGKPPTSDAPIRAGDWVMLHSLRNSTDYNSSIGIVLLWNVHEEMFKVKLLEGQTVMLKTCNLIKIFGPTGNQQASGANDSKAAELNQTKDFKIIACLNKHAEREFTIVTSGNASDVIEKVKLLETTDNTESISAFREMQKHGLHCVGKHMGKPLLIGHTVSESDLKDGESWRISFQTASVILDKISNSNVDLLKGGRVEDDRENDEDNHSESQPTYSSTLSHLDAVAATSGAKSSCNETANHIAAKPNVSTNSDGVFSFTPPNAASLETRKSEAGSSSTWAFECSTATAAPSSSTASTAAPFSSTASTAAPSSSNSLEPQPPPAFVFGAAAAAHPSSSAFSFGSNLSFQGSAATPASTFLFLSAAGQEKKKKQTGGTERRQRFISCGRGRSEQREFASQLGTRRPLGRGRGVRAQDIPWVHFALITDTQQIGSGPFKLVYKARWLSTPVAIQRIRGSGETGRREELAKEVKGFKQLGEHPNLVRYLAISIEPMSGDYCMVTEFAPLGSLDVILANLAEDGETIDLLAQLQVARQICEGMLRLSLRKVVHGDLAARNVLVFRLDAQNHMDVSVKIADYGLSIMANRAYGEGRAVSVSTAGLTARPMRWMAPESIRRRRFSEKSDVWAFGVTMWEVWTYAEVPFCTIEDDGLVGSKVLDGDRLPRPPSCPATVYGIMQECWREKSFQRPSFGDLCKRLQKEYEAKARARVRGVAGDNQQCVCVLCMERKADWALIPCGHLCLCEQCKDGATDRPCPLCRSNPTSVNKIF